MNEPNEPFFDAWGPYVAWSIVAVCLSALVYLKLAGFPLRLG